MVVQLVIPQESSFVESSERSNYWLLVKLKK